MLALLACVVLLAALVVTVLVIRRRHARPSPILRPDPQLIDRPFDPARCAFCDEPGKHACPACERRSCNEHRAWPADRFCWPCEAQWDRGARKRALVLAPLMIGATGAIILVVVAVMVGITRLTGFTSGKLMIGGFLVPLGLGAPGYLKLERRMRRRFRPRTDLPAATLRSGR